MAFPLLAFAVDGRGIFLTRLQASKFEKSAHEMGIEFNKNASEWQKKIKRF